MKSNQPSEALSRLLPTRREADELPDTIFVGHVSMDEIRFPDGERRWQPGGAALYAAVAARTIYDHVGLVTCLGSDYRYLGLLYQLFDRKKALKAPRLSTRSTRFGIVYNADWRAHYTRRELGAGRFLGLRLLEEALETWGRVRFVHFAPMNPQKVLRMIHLVREYAPGAFISMNTCSEYVRSSWGRWYLRRAAEIADLFVLSDEEALALTKASNPNSAARLLPSKTTIVTLGPLGALVRHKKRIWFAKGYPAGRSAIKDPTGAGDVLCGATVAALARNTELITAIEVGLAIAAIKCSDYGFNRLLNLRLEHVSREAVRDLMLRMLGSAQSPTLCAYFEET